MSNSTLMRYGIASVSAVASLPLTFYGFRWVLIRFDEWRRGGPLKFVFKEEMNAAWLALITAVVVFFVVSWALRRSVTR